MDDIEKPNLSQYAPDAGNPVAIDDVRLTPTDNSGGSVGELNSQDASFSELDSRVKRWASSTALTGAAIASYAFPGSPLHRIEGSLLAPQVPSMVEYAALTRTYWRNSRYSAGAEEMKARAKECYRGLSTPAKLFFFTALGLNIVELSPANEQMYGFTGGEAFEETYDMLPDIDSERTIVSYVQDHDWSGLGDIGEGVVGTIAVTPQYIWDELNEVLPAAGAVGLNAGIWEAMIGVGMALNLRKFRPVAEVMQREFFKQPDEAKLEEAEQARHWWKKMMVDGSIGTVTGAAGVTAFHDIREGGRATADNIRSAFYGAAGLLVLDAVLAATILKVGLAMAENVPGRENPVEDVVDVVTHPLSAAVLYGLIFGAIYWSKYNKAGKELEAQRIVGSAPAASLRQ